MRGWMDGWVREVSARGFIYEATSTIQLLRVDGFDRLVGGSIECVGKVGEPVL